MRLGLFRVISLILCLLIAQNKEFSILVANDMHTLGPSLEDQSCPNPNNKESCLVHPYKYGKINLNPPLSLVSLMFTHMQKQLESPDILVLLGDFPAHPYAQDPNSQYKPEIFAELKNVINLVTEQAKIHFPNTAFLPVLGNNDFKYNYQVPKYDEKAEYYEFLYRIWFEEHEPNKKWKNLENIKNTFLTGGFYKVDLENNLRVIVLNTMYYAKSNKEARDPKTTLMQLKWFERRMQEAQENNMQVVLIYHVFPGYCYTKPMVYNFKESYSRFFERILREYRRNILITISGHTHVTSFRFHSMAKKIKVPGEPKRFAFYGNTFISPAISPVYKNNPGYSTFYLEKNENYTTKDLVYTHFDLYKYNQVEELSNFETKIDPFDYFFNYSFTQTYGVQDLSVVSVKKALQKVRQNLKLFKRHIMWSLGIKNPEFFEKAANITVARFGLLQSQEGGYEKWIVKKEEKCKYFCAMREILEINFDKCIKKCGNKK